MRNQIYHYKCPRCSCNIDCMVDIGDHFVEIPEECDECKYKLTKEDILNINADAEIDAIAQLSDRAEDYTNYTD